MKLTATPYKRNRPRCERWEIAAIDGDGTRVVICDLVRDQGTDFRVESQGKVCIHQNEVLFLTILMNSLRHAGSQTSLSLELKRNEE